MVPTNYKDNLPSLEVAVIHYFGVGLMIMAAFYFYLIFLPDQLSAAGQYALRFLILGYAIIAPFWYFRMAKSGRISYDNYSKTLTVGAFFLKSPVIFFNFAIRRRDKIFDDEKTKIAVLTALVKFFFAPLMISFFMINITNLFRNSSDVYSIIDSGIGSVGQIFALNKFSRTISAALISIDTVIFAFAYLVESDRLRNRIKSVDSTFSGWFWALICYPPFSPYAKNALFFILLTPNAGSTVFNFRWLVFFEALSLTALVIYVWATVALGFKSGNLVNRGIVAKGPYRFVRHPAYIAKNLSWLFALAPFLIDLRQLVSWAIWAGVYYARAITEENHLSKDPEYQEYSSRVKYRFIPRVI